METSLIIKSKKSYMSSSKKKHKILDRVKEVWVKNRDGTLEKFNKEKIKEALIKAGAPVRLASKITSKALSWSKKKKEVEVKELEEKVFELTAKNNISVASRFKEFTTKKIIGKVKQQFTRKEVARMLTSLFVIIQIYAFRGEFFELHRGLLILLTSVITSSIVLLLYVGKNEMWKHLLAGILISFALASISALILGIKLEGIVIATAAALPVSTMVNVLKT